MKKALTLIVMTVFSIASCFAGVTHCVVNASQANIELSICAGDSYTATVSPDAVDGVQIICDEQTLYVNEAHACPNGSVAVSVPSGASLELNLNQAARVTLHQVAGPVVATMSGQSGLYVKAGHCPSFKLAIRGNGAVVCDEAAIVSADVTACGPVNMVMSTVGQFVRTDLSKGAALYAHKSLMTSEGRSGDDPAFSIARAYRGAGKVLDAQTHFYDVCATHQEHITDADCDEYKGSPFTSDNEAVQQALSAINALKTAENAQVAYDAICQVPDELEKEREVLGALFCRRLMVCSLAEPIGAGALSPVTLVGVKALSDKEIRNRVVPMLEQMFKGALSAVAEGKDAAFGTFGASFKERVSSLRRFHDRISRTRSVRPQPRWAPFLSQLFRDVETFVMTGVRAW